MVTNSSFMDANDSLYHNFDGFIKKNNKGLN